MKEAERTSTAGETVSERIRTESAGEYSLPDYRPEIRRILAVDTRVLPSGSYRRAGRAEHAGVCVHTVLYAGEDGSLASFEVTTEYGYSFSVPEDAVCASPPPSVESVSCRLTSPRRVSLRASLTATPRVTPAPKYGDDPEGLLSESGVHVARQPITLLTSSVLTEEGVRCRGTVQAPGSLEVLLVRAKPTAVRAETEGGRIAFSGEVAVTVLAKGNGRLPETVNIAIPFEASLSAEALPPAEQTVARAYVTALDLGCAPNDTGGTAFTAELALTLEAEVIYRREISPIIDLFSVKTPLKCRRETVGISETVKIEEHECKVEAAISRTESDSEEALAVIDTSARFIPLGIERGEGELTLSGNLQIESALALGASDPDGRLGHMALGFSQAVTLTLPVPPSLSDAEPEAEVTVVSVSGRLESQAYLASALLSVSIRYTRHRHFTLVVGAERAGEDYPPLPSAELVAVYPLDGDSLFSLARRYRVSPEALASENALPESALADATLPSSLDGRACLTVSYLGAVADKCASDAEN